MFFFFNIVFALWGSLKSHMNFRMSFSVSPENVFGILMESALNI